jgi:hypothetical protein
VNPGFSIPFICLAEVVPTPSAISFDASGIASQKPPCRSDEQTSFVLLCSPTCSFTRLGFNELWLLSKIKFTLENSDLDDPTKPLKKRNL